MLWRAVLIAAVGLGFCGAEAAELEYRYSAEAGVEYASGLRHDHDDNFETPPVRLKDFRYTFELSAGASYTTDQFRLNTSYTFDQRTYEDYNIFHRRRHDAIFEATTDVFYDIALSLRYRYRRSLPEGVVGTIESDQLRIRAAFPEFSYAPARLRIRSSAYSLWQSTDFHKLRFLDANSWEAGSNFTFIPLSDNWTAQFGVTYGLWNARFENFSNSYVDVSFGLSSNRPEFFADSWIGGFGLELDLGYREEWYEGLTSDTGGQRRDRVSSIELTASQPWTERLSGFSRAGFDDHESNWVGENFDEVQVTLGMRWAY